MNWLNLIQLIPMTIIGIQQMHKDAGTPGATKKQLALEALGLAGTVATNVLTGSNAVLAGQLTNLAGSLIDQFTTAFKSAGVFGFTPTPPVATPVPAPAGSVTK